MDIIVFRGISADPCIAAACGGNTVELMSILIDFSERCGVTDKPLREYIVTALADCKSVLSENAERGLRIGGDLYNAALSDIRRLFDLIASAEISYVPSGNPTHMYSGYTNSIKRLVSSPDPKSLLDALIEHYASHGRGILAKYIAYKYDGELHGIEVADNQAFDKLIGLEHQKKVLIDNTAALLDGKPSNNVLLFGDRGTGKSSSVKALLNMFCDKGLRMIELPKQYIKDIPALTAYLSKRVHKYIIFLDDLSFSQNDSEYRALKIAMDGQLQAHPENVLIYATSNRRHLIKESWADREGGDVHRNDNMQETLSLSERFGISLVFSAPNQREYLNIVAGLLKDKGIEMDAELEKKAIIWQMNYGTKSGRCAKQFAASVHK